jgi:hypothetical protein
MNILLALLSLLWTARAANLDLTFMLITSYGGLGRFNSSGTLPAAEIALRTINNRSDILPGYNLVYDEVRDSKVFGFVNHLACSLVFFHIHHHDFLVVMSHLFKPGRNLNTISYLLFTPRPICTDSAYNVVNYPR